MKKTFIPIFAIFASFICLNAGVYPADIEMVLGDAAGTNAFSIKDSNANEVAYIDSRGNMMHTGARQIYRCDYLERDSYMGPWWAGTISSSSGGMAISDAKHPGIAYNSSGSAANTGVYSETSNAAFLIAGSEYSEFVFYLSTTTANTVIRMGFQDSAATTAPTDGVWINIESTTLSGKTSNNSSASTTTSSYTVSTGTSNWYRAAIAVNSDATQVDFYLYNDSGTQLWTDNLTTNIPTATGRETGHGWLAYKTSATAVELLYIDYMSLSINRQLQR